MATNEEASADRDAVENLRGILNRLPPGPVSNRLEVLSALVQAWDSFSGHSDKSTLRDKLFRAEVPTWEPPVLRFTLERHGRTVNGSTRADLHNWEVNLETCQAYIACTGWRQIRKMDKPFKAGPIAAEVADAIVNQREDERLLWESKSQVKLKISTIVPPTHKQTTVGRRERFRAALNEALKSSDWIEVRPGLYERK